MTRGLTLAENEKGRFVAVDERGAVHYLSAAALGEKPWEVQRELEAAFKGEGVVQLPGVAEVRGELQAQRAEEREAARHQRALERAVQWEENRSIWKEQRQLDRQIERVEAALERPQGAVLEAIGRAYAESSNGAEFVSELEQRGLMVCRVSAEEAERSRMQRAVLGTTPRYEEGDVVAMTERGHTYRINAETIAMTATTTYDHVQNVKERLASIEPQEVLSLSQAQEVVVERANERGAMPMPEVDSLPSVGELSRSAERAAGSLEKVAGDVAGAVAKGLESFALGFEAFFFGASRQAPGGAEYVPPSAAPEPPAAPEKSQTRKDKEFMGKQDENAHRDANVKDLMNRSPVAIDATLIARVQRDLEEQQRRREELYRDLDDDWDRDRER